MKTPQELALAALEIAKVNLKNSGMLVPTAILYTDTAHQVIALAEGMEWNDPANRERATFWLRRHCREQNAKAVVIVLDAFTRKIDEKVLSSLGLTSEQFLALDEEARSDIYEQVRKKIKPTETITVLVESISGCASATCNYERLPGRKIKFAEPEVQEEPLEGRFSGMLPKPVNPN